MNCLLESDALAHKQNCMTGTDLWKLFLERCLVIKCFTLANNYFYFSNLIIFRHQMKTFLDIFFALQSNSCETVKIFLFIPKRSPSFKRNIMRLIYEKLYMFKEQFPCSKLMIRSNSSENASAWSSLKRFFYVNWNFKTLQ